jgi:hypothetical protein
MVGSNTKFMDLSRIVGARSETVISLNQEQFSANEQKWGARMKEMKQSVIEEQAEHGSQTRAKSAGGGSYVVGYCRPPLEHQFKPGQGGRKKGSRNKLGEDFLLALANDFESHGAEAIERVRIERPDAYLKIIASLLPRDLNLNVSKYDHLSDEQLIMRLRILTEEAAPIFGRLLDQNPAEMIRLDPSTPSSLGT